MKLNAVIIGVHDFVSQKGTPWRVIYANVDMPQSDDDIGKRATTIFQGNKDDYYNADKETLLGAECKVCSVSGKDAIAYIPAVDD